MTWPWIVKIIIIFFLIALFQWANKHYILRNRSKVIKKSDGVLVLSYPFLELVLGIIGFLFFSLCAYGAWHATPEKSGGIKTALIFYSLIILNLFLIVRYFSFKLYLEENCILRRSFGCQHRLTWKQLHKISMKFDGSLLLHEENGGATRVSSHLDGFSRLAEAILLNFPESATISSPASLVILESCTIESETLQYHYSRIFNLEERELQPDVPQEKNAINFGLGFATRMINHSGTIKLFFVNSKQDHALQICHEIVKGNDYFSFNLDLNEENKPMAIMIERNGVPLDRIYLSELTDKINIK